jgi:hypothetical protein
MKNKDTFTLWGVQEPNTGHLLHHYRTRDDARLWCHGNNRVVKLECRIVDQRPQKPKKPKTFTAHGLEWIPHKPGEPMPCDGEKRVRFIYRCELNSRYFDAFSPAIRLNWNRNSSPDAEIVGWNYAD